MPFIAGKPKTGGRKKGQLARKISYKSVREYLLDLQLFPLQEILKRIPDLSPEQQIKVWLELLAYSEPKMTEARYEKEQIETIDAESTVKELTTEEIIKQLNDSSINK